MKELPTSTEQIYRGMGPLGVERCREFCHNYPRMFERFAEQLKVPFHDQPDVANRTLERLFKAAPKFDPNFVSKRASRRPEGSEMTPLWRWVFGYYLNVSLEVWRSNKNRLGTRKPLSEEITDNKLSEAATEAENNEVVEHGANRLALQKLTKARVVGFEAITRMTLSCEGYSDIAKRYGVSENYVRGAVFKVCKLYAEVGW